jgi:hypothetical protein
VPIVEGVQLSVQATGVGGYGVSDTGSRVFMSGSSGFQYELAWVDRKGNVERLGAPVRAYQIPVSRPTAPALLSMRTPAIAICLSGISRKRS